jgi:broad specificity phosphatase PhoE
VLYVVRHGRPVIDRAAPAHQWRLDPAYATDVRALRPRLPEQAAWLSSPEPKALATAVLLTDDPIEVVADLREHERHTPDWVDDFASVVRRAFARPDLPAYAGWEPLADARARVLAAVDDILARHRGTDVVLVGHGTAWTLLRAAATGTEPDLEWWARLSMPDVQCLGDVGPGDMLSP